MGSTLFPGAQQVIRDAAEAAVSFKDSKPLLEKPPMPRPQASIASSSVAGAPGPQQPPAWVKSLGRGKKKGKKGKGKGKAATGQSQPFRGRGGPAQGSL